MRWLTLTNSRECTKISDRDFSHAFKYNWFLFTNIVKGSRIRYIVRSQHPQVFLHRFILGAKRGEICDHKDGDTLNNQRSNLRICSNKENVRNSKLRKDSSTGYKGVRLVRKEKDRWYAVIKVDNKVKQLGTFSSKKEAALAYNKAAIKAFGKFARLNPL